MKNELELKKYVKLAIQSPKNSEWIKQKRLFLKTLNLKSRQHQSILKLLIKN